jgi:cold shock CspA family protein
MIYIQKQGQTTMTGIIKPITSNSKEFCFIAAADGKDRFAHKDDFPDPSIMKEGQKVMFRDKLAGQDKKFRPVTDVIAA